MIDDDAARQTHLADLIAKDLARAKQAMAEAAEAVAKIDAALRAAQSRFSALATPAPLSDTLNIIAPPWGMSRGGFPFLPRGQSIAFGDNPAALTFLAANWWAQEDWGVWGVGAQHMLRFALDDSYHGGYLEMAVTARSLVAEESAPQLEIVANGYFIGRHVLRPRTHRIVARIPPSCIVDRNISIQFVHQCPVTPRDSMDSQDGRSLGLGLIAMEIN